jgi:hypothetical protein
VYEALLKGKLLYQKKLISIPRPVFIVLYNGLEPFPQQKVMRLSDACQGLLELKDTGWGWDNVEDLNAIPVEGYHNMAIINHCGKL